MHSYTNIILIWSICIWDFIYDNALTSAAILSFIDKKFQLSLLKSRFAWWIGKSLVCKGLSAFEYDKSLDHKFIYFAYIVKYFKFGSLLVKKINKILVQYYALFAFYLIKFIKYYLQII